MKLALFLCGVLVFADERAVAVSAVAATVVLLIVIGFDHGRMSAVLWAGVLFVSALVADVLWQLDWEPFNRSDDYEALPQSPFMLIGLPLPMILVAAGVAARRFSRPERDASA